MNERQPQYKKLVVVNKQQPQRFDGKDFLQFDHSAVDLPAPPGKPPLSGPAPVSSEFLEDERKAQPLKDSRVDSDWLQGAADAVEFHEALIRGFAEDGDPEAVIRQSKEYSLTQATYALRKFIHGELRSFRDVRVHAALKIYGWLRLTNKQIAEECGCSETTVENNLARLYERQTKN